MNDAILFEQIVDVYHEFSKKIDSNITRNVVRLVLTKAAKQKRIVIIDEESGPPSFGVARAFNNMNAAILPGFHEEDGSIVYVDFVYTSNKESMTLIMDALFNRFHNVKQIAFHRKAKSNKQLRVYPINQFNRLTKLIGD